MEGKNLLEMLCPLGININVSFIIKFAILHHIYKYPVLRFLILLMQEILHSCSSVVIVMFLYAMFSPINGVTPGLVQRTRASKYYNNDIINHNKHT